MEINRQKIAEHVNLPVMKLVGEVADELDVPCPCVRLPQFPVGICGVGQSWSAKVFLLCRILVRTDIVVVALPFRSLLGCAGGCDDHVAVRGVALCGMLRASCLFISAESCHS